MRLHLRLRKTPIILTTIGSTALLAASPVFAQNDDNKEDNSAEPAAASTDDPAAAASTEEPAPAESTEPPAEDTATDPPPETTQESAPTTEEAKTTEDPATMTDEPKTTADPSSVDSGITNAPTLTKGHGIPTYPPASVPPTHDAPFMQHSRAPDGTVFIAVGAVLGASALAILLWRIIVGLLLRRSSERAAMAQHDANSKTGFPAPPAPFYKYTEQDSNMSLSGGAAAAGRGVRRTNRGPTPSSNPSTSNLFFSPTAAATGNAGNRGSTFLPSGFYAAGSGSGSQGHGHSISLTNLRPDSRGHGAARNGLGPTPPDSPAFPARRDMSTSSLNLGRPSSQRAPSAYLDDLLADDPGALPPPHMPPSTGPKSPSNLGPGSNRL